MWGPGIPRGHPKPHACRLWVSGREMEKLSYCFFVVVSGTTCEPRCQLIPSFTREARVERLGGAGREPGVGGAAGDGTQPCGPELPDQGSHRGPAASPSWDVALLGCHSAGRDPAPSTHECTVLAGPIRGAHWGGQGGPLCRAWRGEHTWGEGRWGGSAARAWGALRDRGLLRGAGAEGGQVSPVVEG